MQTFLLGKHSIVKKSTGDEFFFLTVGQTLDDNYATPGAFGIAKSADIFVKKELYNKVSKNDFMSEVVLSYNVTLDGKAYLADIEIIPFKDKK